SGALRMLAVTGSNRSRFLPDVPTMREQGFDVVIDSWLGAFAPARTPTQTVRVLGEAINEGARPAGHAESLPKFGNQPGADTPEEFAATVRADIARWGPVVKASGFVATD